MLQTAVGIRALSVVLAAAACGGTSSGTDQCQRAFDAKDYPAAATRCADAYESSGAVRHGVLAGKSHAVLKHDREVVAWAERLGDAPEAAPLWRSAAGAHRRGGRRAAMLAARERALFLWRALGKPGEASYEAHKLWLAHYRSSELLPGLGFARAAYNLARSSDDREMQLVSFTDLFTALDEVGDHAGAKQLHQQAGGSLPASDPVVQFYLQFYAGQLYYNEGRHPLARAAYEQALELAAPAQDPATVRAARLNLVDVCLTLGCLDTAAAQMAELATGAPADSGPPATARRYYGARLAAARDDLATAERLLAEALADDPIPDWSWQLELARGDVFERTHRQPDALAAYGRALVIVESLRSAMKIDDFKQTVLDRKRAPYEKLFRMHATAGRPRAAIAVAERARARSFVEAFVDAGRAADEPPRDVGGGARAQLTALAAIGPGLTASPVLEPRPIADILAALGDTSALVYFHAETSVWLYVYAGNTPALIELDGDARAVQHAIERFEASPDDPGTARELGALLMPPRARAALRRGATLYIVPDGPIGRVPFAALQVAGRPLVVDYDLAYVPSLGALAALRARAATATATAVVIGAPPPTAGAPALPGALAEANQVAQTIGVAAQTGARATAAALRGAADARLLHVASHAGVSPRGAWVQLADGRVYASDIVASRVRPHVAVLASCVSGARRGKGMWGALAAAFLAAGSNAVVATLWSVKDAPTRDMVAAFYHHGGAETPVRALADVQRERIAAGAPASEWAAFVVFGGSE